MISPEVSKVNNWIAELTEVERLGVKSHEVILSEVTEVTEVKSQP